jgi:formate C-acetyltransferase
MITERINRLLKNLKSSSSRIILDANEQENFMETASRVYSRTQHLPEILRRAEFLKEFAAAVPVNIPPDELIVGSQRFSRPAWTGKKFVMRGNHGHICVDYGRVLTLGIGALCCKIAQMPESDNKKAFMQSLEAFAVFIRRHGFAKLAEQPPETFHEALQLVWFIQIFLHAEGNGAAVSFGRFDQYLGKFLEADLKSERISEGQAFELLCCFCIKCCEGDESQNLTLGGKENKLSVLMLQVMNELRIWQPSLSVRIGADTSEDFWEAALNLCSTGIGMPSFFNEPVVSSGLKKLGIPAARAEDWGIVGCYEASPQGDCYPLTVAGGFTLPELLWNFLQTRSSWKSFDSFYDGLKIYFNEIYLQKILPSFKQRWNDFCRNCPSPFESICVNGCIESGLAVEEGGAIFNLFGVNILGLGTLVDSLLSIKELIFEAEDLTFEQIKQQLNDNYPNQKLLLRCRNLPGKFGTNTSESNKLAHDISAFIANTVIKNPLPGCVRPYPGFFRFGQDINQKFMASADGRLADERISYGSGPGVFLDRADITSILNSAACVAHKSCACGNPLLISLNRKDASGIEGRQRIRHLVESYFRQGGFHLHFNITDAEYLENAKLNPDDYSELIVRISGFSANFVRLDALWQDAIIERTKSGM